MADEGLGARLRARVGDVGQKVVDWARPVPGPGPELRPLTAEYRAGQHEGYLSHLNRALEDSSVRNIALTGRYGAGKSSVIAEFARQNRRRVLLLALSTLGPEDPNESRTNQIQKELVKQLLHREKPSTLPQSRYQRIDRLRLGRALFDSAVALGVFGVLLWLLGVFPEMPGLDGDQPKWVRAGAAAVAGAALVLLVARIRLAVHNRLEVSQVSAAGASVTLSKQADSDSYFDRYLDEIVYFFEIRRRVDVVVFEDLDRFNQAGIFEAVRELNTLLNNSKQITGRHGRWSQPRTIRFVYALKDSIFEQLGHDSKKLSDDAAEAEAVRANRTKFFDLVIPMVPFITHSTARDLLANLLTSDDLTAVPRVSDDLVDLVGRHVSDMRLLTNIRNEYVVFARRLITDGHGMDTLTPDQLFALVAYKNFHLDDFERLPLGRSSLDVVYKFSRQVVTENIASRRARLRELVDGIAMQRATHDQAQVWGHKLHWFASKVDNGAANASIRHFNVGGTEHQPGNISTPEFWRELLDTNTGVEVVIYSQNYRTNSPVSLDMDELEDLLGGGFRPGDWSAPLEEQQQTEHAKVSAELSVLRTADFVDLAEHPMFLGHGNKTPFTFRAYVDEHIASELGKALVNSGYIDRYYNLYSAQYYGDRVPANAMSFIVQNVDTNTPDINYPFNGPDEIAAVLKETKGSFLNDISAYNIEIVDYLFASADPRARLVLDKVRAQVGEHERAFLDAYLSEGQHASDAVAYLANIWPSLLTDLVDAADISQEARIKLVDVALANATETSPFDFSDSVTDFLKANHKKFPTLAPPPESTDVVEVYEVEVEDVEPSDEAIANAVGVLRRIVLRCDDLAALRPAAVRELVEGHCYELTAANLRVALGPTPTLGLDSIRDLNPKVYEYVVANPEGYLAAIDTDHDPDEVAASPSGPTSDHLRTLFSIADPEKFTSIVDDFATCPSDQQFKVFVRANPRSRVHNLTDVSTSTWAALAQARRISSTLENVDAYVKELAGIDEALASILTDAGKIASPKPSSASEDVDPDDPDGLSPAARLEQTKADVAKAVLRAADVISDPKVRVDLVASLDSSQYLPASLAPVEAGKLLGYLISAEVCEDSHATFARFNVESWPTLLFGIQSSKRFEEFVDPTILGPKMTSSLLSSPEAPSSLKKLVLGRFDDYVPPGEAAALAAAGNACIDTGVFPGTDRLTTIVNVTADSVLALKLAVKFIDTMSPDQVRDVVAQAPEPYSRLGVSGSELTFPMDSKHTKVLSRLEEGNLITTSTPKSRIPGKAGSGIAVTVH